MALRFSFGPHPSIRGPFVVSLQSPSNIETVISAIKAMPHSGRLMFGTKSAKPPAPILMKKLLLMLIAASILQCEHVLVTPANSEASAKQYDLALGLATFGLDGTILALHDDSF